MPDAGHDEIASSAPARAAEILDGLPDRYRRILELRFLEAQDVGGLLIAPDGTEFKVGLDR